jgi:hypothetical protein
MSRSTIRSESHPRVSRGESWSRDAHSERHDARGVVSARQAWQFAVVPLSLRGSRLAFATSARRRARAERFVARVLHLEPHAHVLEEATLAACLDAMYPLGHGRQAFLRGLPQWTTAPSVV